MRECVVAVWFLDCNCDQGSPLFGVVSGISSKSEKVVNHVVRLENGCRRYILMDRSLILTVIAEPFIYPVQVACTIASLFRIYKKIPLIS